MTRLMGISVFSLVKEIKLQAVATRNVRGIAWHKLPASQHSMLFNLY
jgi:hypothetical protein